MGGFAKVDGRFLFADNVRFWCMFAVVALHCSSILLQPGQVSTLPHCALSTVLKFGTIGFFLISGFLLGKGLQGKAALPLLGTRIRKVFLPWGLWFLLFVGVRSTVQMGFHHAPFKAGFNLPGVLSEVNYALTGTSTWFVPNLLLSLAVLLCFGRFLHRFFVGAMLLAADLLYTANIYANWFSTAHTRALFAFVFYLWLGHQVSLNLHAFGQWLGRIPARVLLGLTACAGVAAFGEAQLLLRLHSADPLNTLRLSNQVYSVLVVLCLCKLRRRAWPRFVNVSRDIFGIYLSHALVVGSCLALLRWGIPGTAHAVASSGIAMHLLLWAAATAISWSAGFLLTRLLATNRVTAWFAGTYQSPAGHEDPVLSRPPRPAPPVPHHHPSTLRTMRRGHLHPVKP